MANAGLILYHKQATSARTRFLRLAHGGVCAFAALDERASLLSDDEADARTGDAVVPHPAPLAAQATTALGLEPGTIEIDSGYRHTVETPQGLLRIFLARFTTTDPPFAAVEKAGASFIDITQARGLPPAELELLRAAYELVLG